MSIILFIKLVNKLLCWRTWACICLAYEHRSLERCSTNKFALRCSQFPSPQIPNSRLWVFLPVNPSQTFSIQTSETRYLSLCAVEIKPHQQSARRQEILSVICARLQPSSPTVRCSNCAACQHGTSASYWVFPSFWRLWHFDITRAASFDYLMPYSSFKVALWCTRGPFQMCTKHRNY